MSGSNLGSNDPLPKEFFDCNQGCKPTNDTKFYKKYQCEMQCSGSIIWLFWSFLYRINKNIYNLILYNYLNIFTHIFQTI